MANVGIIRERSDQANIDGFMMAGYQGDEIEKRKRKGNWEQPTAPPSEAAHERRTCSSDVAALDGANGEKGQTSWKRNYFVTTE